MYPRSFLCEEAKIKQHTSSKKELCEISEKAMWESRFTCFLYWMNTLNFLNSFAFFYKILAFLIIPFLKKNRVHNRETVNSNTWRILECSMESCYENISGGSRGLLPRVLTCNSCTIYVVGTIHINRSPGWWILGRWSVLYCRANCRLAYIGPMFRLILFRQLIVCLHWTDVWVTINPPIYGS